MMLFDTVVKPKINLPDFLFQQRFSCQLIISSLLKDKKFEGKSAPCSGHGKMYKRYTFDNLALHSELVSGFKDQIKKY